MRHINVIMSNWALTLPVFLALAFVPVQPAETRVDPLDWGAMPQVSGPTRPNETQEGSPGPQMVGQVGGRTEDVAVQGDYAYVAVGLRLVVLDVSDPTAPAEIGSTMPFSEFVEGVTVSGSLAYVAAGTAGLWIVDISDPAQPAEIGAYDTPG